MAFIANTILDNGLVKLDDDTNILHICSSEPADYAGIAAVTLGNKTTPTLSVPEAGDPNGRQITVSAITDGSVTATNTASHWVLADTVGSVLLASGAITTPQSVTDGNTFTLTSFTVRIAAAA